MGQISVKLKDADEAKIKKAAQAENKTLAQYCREVLTNETEAEPIDRVKIEEELAALREEVIHQNELTRALFKIIFFDEKKTSIFIKRVLRAGGATAEELAKLEQEATDEANVFLKELGR